MLFTAFTICSCTKVGEFLPIIAEVGIWQVVSKHLEKLAPCELLKSWNEVSVAFIAGATAVLGLFTIQVVTPVRIYSCE